MKNFILSLGILFALFSSTAFSAGGEFPGRAEYPEISLYSKAHLLKDFNKVVIVDARSALEFETLRINNALNIPVASRHFAKMVKELRSKTTKPIVFYCNGRSCYKSYKAAKIAQKYGVKNVFAYDAGVFEWAKAHPKYATLLATAQWIPLKSFLKLN